MLIKPSVIKTYLLFVFCCVASIYTLSAQSIILADGSALPDRYCWEDDDYALTGIPEGGIFFGCGVFEANGQWYFNPVTATQGDTVFAVQCPLSYVVNGDTTSQYLLIWKPVVITPALEDTFTCDGAIYLEAYTLYVGAYDYQWTPAAPLDRPDTSITAGYITETTTFVVTATDHTSGCTGSDTITIEKHPKPQLIVSNDTTITARGTVQLLAQGASDYLWMPARWLDSDTIPNPLAKPQAPITYEVIGINEYGCSDTAAVAIDIREQLFVPNAFSPNGDGVNDIFRLENYGYQGVNAFMIFNRWGEKVFQTNDGTQGWDGTYKGQPADAGTYYYDIRLGLLDGTEKVLRGDLTLIR